MLGFEGDNAREKVIVLLTMCFALAMAMLDNTVVNVALPSIQNGPRGGLFAAPVGGGRLRARVRVPAARPAASWAIATAARRCSCRASRSSRCSRSSVGCLQNANAADRVPRLPGRGWRAADPGDAVDPHGDVPPARASEGPRASGPASPASPSRSARRWAATWWSTSAGSRCSSSTCRSASWRSSSRSRTVTESVSETERQLDVTGLVLGTSALFFVTYGLIEANQLGWSQSADRRIVHAVRAAAGRRSSTGRSRTRTR